MKLIIIFSFLAHLLLGALATNDTTEIQQSKAIQAKLRPLDLLPGIIANIIPEIIDIFNEEDAECAFVDKLVSISLLTFRDMNVVVFADQASRIDKLVNRECYTEKRDLAFFRSKTYTVCVFQQGQFVRAGDGGCRNWGYGKCSRKLDDQTVNFCLRTAGATETSSTRASTVTTRTVVISTTTRNVVSSTTSGKMVLTSTSPRVDSVTVTEVLEATTRPVIVSPTVTRVTITQISTATDRPTTGFTAQGGAGSSSSSAPAVPTSRGVRSFGTITSTMRDAMIAAVGCLAMVTFLMG